ncbi:acetylornithine transaminase [Actinomadura madurae]|uniref:acetylornithine transaminase n=1 Tax=Actinomadura madurae TaxID=1993 RepID=UPI0020D2552D|nr:acetylornithine transaminase [Actinomadura madurae]MCP9956055.1 acetylornithine transaminase [Actinomadura madurae]MCP9972670.1 acetylornithine transaminase [Actinomadura madurae]MCP9985311.1 acetylornithine transaminase [Actinomadura madurae]MCQ0012264.1 acetylornithine transaminase [Actinomadura madurae]MCQ0021398.1 acetylornithine transaminase [Actinomadura madurae]
MSDLRERFEAAFMPNYGVPPVALARGEGCRVWDTEGREYLDLIAGIAVSSLGHAHPALVAAVSSQVATLAHTSNLFLHEPEVLLAERLRDLLGGGRVFLANSGTEANECALKLAIKYGKTNGRSYFVAAENGFHGRSLGALSLTGKASIREPFGPFGIDVRFVPYGDAAALETAVDEDCAAVFLEPAQGEAGVVPPPDGYFAAARRVCDGAGALFVADEIQSAIGRTGTWFAFEHENARPDVLTLAKGLGGGLPIGACVAFGPNGDLFAKGDHGSTFGGNPVAAAAALAVLTTIEKDGLLAHAAAVGETLAAELDAIGHPLLAGVRGRGLWRAAVLTGPHAPAVEAAARDAGFLVNALQPDAVRLAPPLILTAEQARSFAGAFPAILDAASPEQEN